VVIGIGPDLHILNGRRLSVERITAEVGFKSMGGAKGKPVNSDHQANPGSALADAEKLVGYRPLIVETPFMSHGRPVRGRCCHNNTSILSTTTCVGTAITSSGFKDIFRRHFNNKAYKGYPADLDTYEPLHPKPLPNPGREGRLICGFGVTNHKEMK